MMFNMTEEEFAGPMRVDYFGTFACARHAARDMRSRKWGRIINTGDGSGLYGLLGGTNVGAAKGGIHAMTMIWAIELQRYNITANCVIPYGYTRMHDPLIRKALEEAAVGGGDANLPTFDEVVAGTDRPEESTSLVAYLCSDEAEWVTGQIFGVRKDRITLWSRPREKVEWTAPGGLTLDAIRADARETLGAALEPLDHQGAD